MGNRTFYYSTSGNWCELLKIHPEFADKCCFRFDGAEWSSLLSVQPQFADKCPWEKLNGCSWGWLLKDQPQFADKCDWQSMNSWFLVKSTDDFR